MVRTKIDKIDNVIRLEFTTLDGCIISIPITTDTLKEVLSVVSFFLSHDKKAKDV